MWKYAFSLVCAACLLTVAAAQVTYPVHAVPLPGAPLQIVSAEPASRPAPPGIPPQVASRLTSWQVTVKNTGSAPIVAYTVRYIWADGRGKTFRGKGHCSTRMSDPNRPVLAPGQTMKLSNQIVHPSPGKVLDAEVDMVLTADGHAYGRNVCGTLQTFQQSLVAKRAAEEWILNVLNTQGPDKAKELLKADLAGVITRDRAVLLPHLHGSR